MASFTAKKVGKGRERAKIKIVFPFRSYPDGKYKTPKKEKKIKKNTIVVSFQAKIRWKRSTKERK